MLKCRLRYCVSSCHQVTSALQPLLLFGLPWASFHLATCNVKLDLYSVDPKSVLLDIVEFKNEEEKERTESTVF